MLRDLKRRLLAMLPPVIFLGITFYFAWNAIHGARGLQAQAVERAQLAKAQHDFAVADAARQQWQTKVGALGGPAIAPDILDEQARIVLNLAAPSDLVVDLPPAGK